MIVALSCLIGFFLGCTFAYILEPPSCVISPMVEKISELLRMHPETWEIMPLRDDCNLLYSKTFGISLCVDRSRVRIEQELNGGRGRGLFDQITLRSAINEWRLERITSKQIDLLSKETLALSE